MRMHSPADANAKAGKQIILPYYWNIEGKFVLLQPNDANEGDVTDELTLLRLLLLLLLW